MQISLVTAIGVTASVLTAVSLLPQLIKIIREKKAEGISVWMLLTLATGLGLWVVYGCMKEDLIIAISNGFSLLVNAVIGVFTIRYSDN